jgi:hypothetical protein
MKRMDHCCEGFKARLDGMEPAPRAARDDAIPIADLATEDFAAVEG